MSSEDEDPLEELVVDRKQVNRERVADALDGILNIDNDGNSIRDKKFSGLNSKEKLVAVMLSKWVASELGFVEVASIELRELCDRIGLSESGVYKYIHELDFIYSNSNDGEYHIPDKRIIDAVDYLESENQEKKI